MMEFPRDQLWAMLDHSNRLVDLRKHTLNTVENIDYIDLPISYGEFLQRYLLPNRACILGPWATNGWRSREEWVTEGGKPNLDFLKQKFGWSVAPVANCNKEEFCSHPKTEMTVADFIDYLQRNSSGDNKEEDILYLKDWHFVTAFPDYDAYVTPVFFQSDWMNEFWDSREDVDDDYRFVYFGAKGSWTPFHADVLRSFSWSANICGCKKWIFFPPGEEECLKDIHGNIPFDLNSSLLEDEEKYPKVTEVTKRFEVFQKEGEVIFVPSGWHHQVFNMEDTVSINHNWLNGCNVDLCWAFVKDSLKAAQREIEDCKDMEGWGSQCQLILKATSGINYQEFYQFMLVIGQRRISAIESILDRLNSSSDSAMGPCELSESSSLVSSNDAPMENRNVIGQQRTSSISPNGGRDSPRDNELRAAGAIEGQITSVVGIKAAETESDGRERTSPDGIEIGGLTLQPKICQQEGQFAAGSRPCVSSRPAIASVERLDLGALCHLTFDLMQAKAIAMDMKHNKEFLEMDLDTLPSRPKQFIQRAEQALSKAMGVLRAI